MAMLGARVGPAEAEVDAGLGGGLFDTQTLAGWAVITALAAFAILFFLVGRGEGGLRRAVKVVEFVVIVGLAEVVFNFLVRQWADKTDSAFADGLDYNV